jgi:DNA-binding MarR family transcriptional regulator
MINQDKTETDSTRQLAERLFEAFSAVGPFKRRPGFGHAARPGEFQLIHRLAHEAHATRNAGSAPDSGLRVGDLAAWLGVKPPTVTQLVGALESRGLVERFADADDRRAIRVRLSAEGRQMADSFHARAMAETEALVTHLGIADSEKLSELLSKTAAFLGQRHGQACACPHHGQHDHHPHQPRHPLHGQEGEK